MGIFKRTHDGVSTAGSSTSSSSTSSSPLRRRNVVIDLVAESTRGQRWGQPGHCPACGSMGFLDRIDLVGRELYQHCPTCSHHWITSERDLESTRR